MSLECKNCGHQFEPFENFVRDEEKCITKIERQIKRYEEKIRQL